MENCLDISTGERWIVIQAMIVTRFLGVASTSGFGFRAPKPENVPWLACPCFVEQR